MSVSQPNVAAAAPNVNRLRTFLSSHETQEAMRGWLWFSPALILLLALAAYPATLVIWMSFQKTQFFELTGFVGLANYQELLTSESFWQFTFNSLAYVFGTLLLVLPMGLLAALLIQALGIAGDALRVILLVPWTLSQAVVGSFWLWILNPSYGPIAYVIYEMGLQPGLILGDPDLALILVICVTAWWSFPYAMVMTSASLQSIPKELNEALSIDGGGRLQSLRYVIWPHVAPAMGSAGLTLAILYLMLITMIIVLTGGGPFGSTSTWSFAIFRGTTESVNLAPTAALSVVVLLANLMLGWSYFRFTGRVSG